MSEVKRPRCSFCDREAIITIKYARLRLCKRHLEEFLIKRLKKVELPKRVLLGLSGGKDSVALLYLLKKVGTEVVAATVDTVPNYTSLEAELAKRVAEELGVTHYTVYAKELYGFTALSYKKLRRAPCSICSKLRRHALELLARRLGIEYIATGHNMDDMASWALSYILRGDFQSLKKVRPVERPKGPARGRVKPLFWIGEKEIMTFLLSKKLPWLKASCPLYEPRSTFVDYVKETILKLEERYGNVRINLLNYVVRREGGNEGEGEPNACKYCGGPAWGEVCSVCSLRRKVGKLDERPLEPKAEVTGNGNLLIVGQGTYAWAEVGGARRVREVFEALEVPTEAGVFVHKGKPAPPESALLGELERGEAVLFLAPRVKPKLSRP